MRRARAKLAVAILVFLVACDDQPFTGPDAPPPPAGFGISDGAHDDGINQSNDDFFFLPPLVKEPVGMATYKDDPAHQSIEPRVEICLVRESDLNQCESSVRTFEASQLSITEDQYQVNWDTKESALLTGRVYRIAVFIQSTRLGYADIIPVSTGREVKSVTTDEYIGLVDDRTLPLKFRIEQGALCETDPCTEVVVNSADGATVHAADGGSAIQIPPDALPVSKVVLKIERKHTPPGSPCVDDSRATSKLLRQWEGCYLIETDPDLDDVKDSEGEVIGFLKDVVVGICLPEDLPEPLRDHLQMVKFDADKGTKRLRSVPAPFLNCDKFEPTSNPNRGLVDRTLSAFGDVAKQLGAFLGPRPLYAVDGGLGGLLERELNETLSTFFFGLPITAEAIEGEDQSAPAGSPVVLQPAVLIMTAHGHTHEGEDGDVHQETVSDAPVRFSVTSGGGELRRLQGESSTVIPFVDVPSDQIGVARLPDDVRWFLGSGGENRLIASGPFDNGDVAFTATVLVDVIGAWFPGASLDATRRDQTSTLLGNGDVLLVAGTASGALRYDAATAEFSALSTAFEHGQGASATLLDNGRVLIVGGNGAPGRAELFDPAANTFTAIEQSLITPRSYHSATLLPDGRVLIAGGQQNVEGGPQTIAAAEIFDPGTNSFTATGALQTDRSTHAPIVLTSGEVLVLGGHQTTTPGFAISLASTEIYDPSNGTFRAGPNMHVARGGADAVTLEGGIVFVYGGGTARGELFDLETGTFTQTAGSMPVPVWSGSVTLLADGRVLIAGGVLTTGSEAVSSDVVAVYDPAFDAFLPAASMTMGRQQHSATLLQDGRVLVVGGFNFAVDTDLNTSELFSLAPPIQ